MATARGRTGRVSHRTFYRRWRCGATLYSSGRRHRRSFMLPSGLSPSAPVELLEGRRLLSTVVGVCAPPDVEFRQVEWNGRLVSARAGEWILRLDGAGDARGKVDRLNARLARVTDHATAVRQLGADGWAL